MPLPKLCTERGCNIVSTDGNPKCHLHRSDRRKPRAEVAERATFYNTTRWTKFSRLIRSERPVCELCDNELTSDLDHFIERSIDYRKDYEFDPRNMVCLCKACHYRKGTTVKRMIEAHDYNKLYQWMLNNHPRPQDTDYLHEWITNTLEDRKQGIQHV
ncbi:hypothetical protein L4D00_15025 [Photobacterium swingsii]|uniref:hypothetical protein n=1 Tax=Photobacterium swingsii TaxID=680026 RepID=UPI003D0DB5AA